MELQLIQNRIYEIRGYKVMLDRDLAELYGIETKRLKESVRRNERRFPNDFMFELSKEEFYGLRSQFATSNQRGGSRYLPYAFTEQGVAMLSSVLNSDAAIEINIGIMRAFVAVRNLILSPQEDKIGKLQQDFEDFKEYLEEVFSDYNDINENTRMQLELINESLAEFHNENKRDKHQRPKIGYDKYRDEK